jgi:hypothetical protein
MERVNQVFSDIPVFRSVPSLRQVTRICVAGFSVSSRPLPKQPESPRD